MAKFIDVSVTKTKDIKQTIFTHLFSPNKGWIKVEETAKDYEEIKYLGKCQQDGDMFQTLLNGCIDIFKGVKGDEFNN